jgi:hypothetical protein
VCIPKGTTGGEREGCGACFVVPATFGNGEGDDGCTVFANNPANSIMVDGKKTTRPCPIYIKNWKGNPEIGPVCLFTDYDQESSWYNVVNQYGSETLFLCGVSVLSLVLYFITSSDSGSLVVDTISGNGRDEQNPFQRVFWAFTEGAVATALITSGDNPKAVLKSLQSASICSGLPFTFLLCFMMPSLLYALENKKRKDFETPIFGGIFDFFEWMLTLGQAPLPKENHVAYFFIYLLAPFLALYKLQDMCQMRGAGYDLFGSQALYGIVSVSFASLCWVIWIILLAVNENVWIYGWICFLAFVSVTAMQREKVRQLNGVDGNIIWDWMASLFYPQVFVQCVEAMEAME